MRLYDTIQTGDDMNTPFVITRLHRVILIEKNEYKEKSTSFKCDYCKNELIYHFSGKSNVIFNGKKLETSPNCIRFLPAGEVHEYTVERIVRGECIDVFFDADVPIAEEAFILKIKQNEKIANLFKKVFSVWVAKGDGYYFECVSLLYRIFAEVQKQSYIPKAQYSHIQPAVEYIKKHFLEQKITAETLCSCCDISYPYIKRLFIKRFGVPPVKYAIQLKINYACDLLRSERYSVSQVADVCGYPDPNFFSRQFKKYVGCSPTEFMKKVKSSK